MLMKLTTLLILTSCLHLSAAVYSQNITITEKQVKLETLLGTIEKQSGYTFFYKQDLLSALPSVTVKLKKVTIGEAMDTILKGLPISYDIVGNTIVIKAAIAPAANPFKLIPKLFLGRVLDESDQPLPGASIREKGTQNISYANDKGEFSILVKEPAQQTLQFSYVGYDLLEVKTSSLNNPVQVRLKATINSLDQVQVLAYSTTSKRLNIGNTYTITAKELEKNPVPNVLQTLQNRVPGLEIGQTTGQVGGSFNVKIRGINGFSNVDPLYIVDGVPYPAGGTNFNPNGQSGGLPTLRNNRGSGTLAQQGGNALNYINPEDIETIDVLKDAEATSIYGSRGAYGVILITTKKGSMNKNGSPSLYVNINRSTSSTGTFPELLNTEQYLTIRREAIANDGLTVTGTDLDLNGTYPADKYTNWAKELTDYTATGTRVHTRYSGGNELSGYSVAASYNDQGNVLRSKGYNRDGGLKFDLNTNSKDRKFSMQVSALLNSTVNTMVPYEFSGDAATLRAPNSPSFFKEDGSLNWIGNLNPYSFINTDYRGITNNILGSTNLSYAPVKGLTIKALVSYNLLSGNELRQVPISVFAPTDATATTKANSASNIYNIRTWSFEPHIGYVSKLGKDGTISAIAGATFQDKLIHQDQITGTGFVADARLNNPSAATTVTTAYNKSFTRYMGYFGGLNYNWKNKYLLSLSTRYDGSTKFGPDHRYGWFGSVGGVYIFSEEQLIKDNLPFLSFGKIRGSYGTTGGDGIQNFLYLGTYATGTSYLGNTVFTTSALANNSLHWETNKKLDYGISLGFFKDRIVLDASYYRNRISDQLITQPLTSVTGFASVLRNSPSLLQNTGYELSLTTSNISKAKFTWSSTVVMSIPDSKVVSLPEQLLNPNLNYVLGLPITNVKVFDYTGVNPQTGEYNYRNAAGDIGNFQNALTINDKIANVNLAPKLYGSISNSFSYGNISLDFTFSFVNKIGTNFQGQLTYLPGYFDRNTTTWALDRWQKPGDITDVPKATTNLASNLFGLNNFRQSSGAYERIIFSRLQNASLSYSLPKSILSKVKISNARFSVQGQNLFTISKYKDLDPENMSLNSLPPLRVINLGINLTL
jgi:TonB-linked SusC/RagA family outer membrane protein